MVTFSMLCLNNRQIRDQKVEEHVCKHEHQLSESTCVFLDIYDQKNDQIKQVRFQINSC